MRWCATIQPVTADQNPIKSVKAQLAKIGMALAASVSHIVVGPVMHVGTQKQLNGPAPAGGLRLGLCLLATLVLSGCSHFETYDEYETVQPVVVRPAPDSAGRQRPRSTSADTSHPSPSRTLPQVQSELLERQAPPNCKDGQLPTEKSTMAGKLADPKLLEIVQLESQRDCYSGAEVSVRKRLERLQNAVRPLK